MATTNKRTQVEQEITETFGLVPQWVHLMPESAIQGFWTQMRDLQLGETKIPNKYKELIGLAVSGATRCKYCQLFHIEAARLNGATEDEIAEACMMGAHTMAASTFLNSIGIEYEEFKTETLQIVSNIKAQQAQKAPEAKSKPKDQARV
ncbi:MAG: carboxymuconolactone decarboxylase family protein [Archangium sp.]|nr:carboxymuconolactone decarboxylase family protein [Archangium sp.]MDP3151193.1 carboxymuconolactone decarboxylase family protein [Archangium sp.]MDP3570166.1 carboxymuconolactone decarboxylase family protein [Archangium sp.]